MYDIKQTKNIALVQELHSRLFPDDSWVGDHHTFWIATDMSGVPVGFASAVHREDLDYVFLSRAGVDKSASGQGLQRRLIRARIAWAKKRGVSKIITYTSLKNYPSIINLLACGFRFDKPKAEYVGSDVHYFKMELT